MRSGAMLANSGSPSERVHPSPAPRGATMPRERFATATEREHEGGEAEHFTTCLSWRPAQRPCRPP